MSKCTDVSCWEQVGTALPADSPTGGEGASSPRRSSPRLLSSLRLPPQAPLPETFPPGAGGRTDQQSALKARGPRGMEAVRLGAGTSVYVSHLHPGQGVRANPSC